MPVQFTLDDFQTTNRSEMQQKSKPKNSKTSTFSLEDFLAKLSALLENEKDLTIQEERYFLKSQGFSKTKDPDIFYLKTLGVYYLTTREKLSRQYLKFSPTWGIALGGRCLTAKTSEFHKGERVFIEGYFGGECSGEILPLTRNDEEDTRRVSKTYYGTRQGRVHKDDEIMNCLGCDGHNGGGNKSLSNPRTDKVEREREHWLNLTTNTRHKQSMTQTDCHAHCQPMVEDKAERQGFTLSRELIRLNDNEYHCQGERLYSHNGLSVALNAAGNNDWYTTDDLNEREVKRRYSKDC